MEARFEARETHFGGNGSSHPAARAANCRLPMLDGAQGDRHSRGIIEGARNCDKSRSAASRGVAQAASDDPRIERDHRGGDKYNYVFHSFVWLICSGEVLNVAHSAAGACAIDRMPP
jgi:hypothetical protein